MLHLYTHTHDRQNACSYSTPTPCAHCDTSDVQGHSFPHASRSYRYPPVHVLAVPMRSVLCPVCSRTHLARSHIPALHAFSDPSGVYVLPCPTCGVACPCYVCASFNRHTHTAYSSPQA